MSDCLSKIQPKLPYTNNVDAIEVVLKITARCNIKCKYCYYFNNNHNSPSSLPSQLSVENIDHIILFLSQAIRELDLRRVNIDFHGGETLLYNKKRFIYLCNELSNNIGTVVELNLRLQTNGFAVDSDWIDIFSRFDIGVGVSLDGPKQYNDLNRLDKNGHSTYGKVKKGIELLKHAHAEGRISDVGLLCVIDPKSDAGVVFRHFVNDLAINRMDFLLPDFTHDNYEKNSNYSIFLKDIFNSWLEHGYDKSRVRFISRILDRLTGNKENYSGSYSNHDEAMIDFTIQTDGTLGPDDTFFSTPVWNKIESFHVKNITLKEFLSQPELCYLSESSKSIPIKCKECCWSNICGGGGTMAHQYSSKTDDCSNPSVYCEDLKDIYSEISAYLLNHGMSSDELIRVLGIEE